MTPLLEARERRRQGDYAGALACLDEHDPATAAERGRNLLRLGDLPAAHVAAEAAPDEGEGRIARIEVALARGEGTRATVLASAWLSVLVDQAETAVAAFLRADPAIALSLASTSGPGDAPNLATNAPNLATHPLALAEALDLLSSAAQLEGDASRGVALSRRALDLAAATEASGESWPADLLAGLRHTLAEALHRSGRLLEARAEWETTLDLRKRAFSADHPDIAATLDGLGTTLCRMGLAEAAAVAHVAALPIHRRRLPATHPAICANLHAHGQALRRLGRFEDARMALAEALALSEESQGDDHPDVWVSRFELGRMEVDCGQVEEGFHRMEAAFRAMKARFGPLHPTVRSMEGWL